MSAFTWLGLQLSSIFLRTIEQNEQKSSLQHSQAERIPKRFKAWLSGVSAVLDKSLLPLAEWFYFLFNQEKHRNQTGHLAKFSLTLCN